MDKALIGILGVAGILHLILVLVPVRDTLGASISLQSKLAWCAFLLLLPFVGVAVFHFLFRSSMFQGKAYEPTSQELGAPSGFKRNDKDQ